MVFVIDPDIRRALLPPADFYRKPLHHEALRTRILARSWQAYVSQLPAMGELKPFTWLAGAVDESLVWTRDAQGALSCLSNVCTHRGALLCSKAKRSKSLLCPYHGRRFDLGGRLRHAPGFDDALDFPRERDHLRQVQHRAWGPLAFSALDPDSPFDAILDVLRDYFDFLSPEQWQWDESGRRDYPIAANWMLYCDNYLEGFHVPFVHPELSRAIEMSSYETRRLDGAVMQVAFAREGEPAIRAPAGHPDAGQDVAAWYLFVFPNLMLNVYPWGLSLNRVRPTAVNRCTVEYARWLRPGLGDQPEALDSGAGGGLDTVEAEDQEVVLSAQAGLASRLYPGGRYSPEHEKGLHHFHRWLAAGLGYDGGDVG